MGGEKRPLVICLFVLAGLALAPGAAAQDAATVNVVHGIPGFVVDLCLSGPGDMVFEKIRLGATYRSVTTVERVAGSYTLRAVQNGDDCNTPAGPSIGTTLTLVPLLNLSAVAALSADGKGYEFFQFANDTSTLGFFGRDLNVRHLAAAPRVDFRYGRIFTRNTIPNLFYGTMGFGSPSRRTRTELTSPETGDRVFGPRTVTAPRRQTTIVNIVGSAEDGTLDYAVEYVDRAAPPPGFSLDVEFTPDNDTPGADTVSLAQGLSLGGILVLDVNVTDTTGIYAAEFDVVFDGELLSYLFFSPGTLLEQGGATVDYDVSRAGSGRLSVAATRVGAVGGADAVDTVRLIRLILVVSGPGDSPVDFENMELLDPALVALPGIVWDGGDVSAVEVD